MPGVRYFFPSLHAVRTHIGKAHAEASTSYTQSSYAEKSARQDKHMTFALNGLPQCRCCFKKLPAGELFAGIISSERVLFALE